MKKIFVYVTAIILLVSLGFALTLNNKEDALTSLREFRANRDKYLDDALESIIITTDKVATLNIETEEIEPIEICYEVMFNLTDYVLSGCVESDETTSLEEDEKRVREDAVKKLRDNYPEQTFSYVVREMKGTHLFFERKVVPINIYKCSHRGDEVCDGGLSGGLGTRCYLNEEKSSWIVCVTGWYQ